MNITSASHYLLQGLKIRRTSWDLESYLIKYQDIISFYYKNGTFGFLWEPSIEDLMADDWEIKKDI